MVQGVVFSAYSVYGVRRSVEGSFFSFYGVGRRSDATGSDIR